MKKLIALISLALISTCSFAYLNDNDDEVVKIEHEPSHRPVFKNGFMRIFDALILPGQKSLYHSHLNDSFFFCIEGALATNEEPGKPMVKRPPIKTGEIYYRPYATKNFVHRVGNESQNPFRILDVEVVGKPSGYVLSKLDPKVEEILNNEKGRVSKFKVSPDEKLVVGKVARGVLTTGQQGSIQVWYGETTSKDSKVKAGDLLVRNLDGTELAVKNTGETDIELVLIEIN